MKLFAGIDAGQSGTTAAIGDESGQIVGRGKGPAADEIGQDATSTRLRDALKQAIRDALRSADLPKDTEFEKIVAGVSGYEGRVYGRPPKLNAKELQLMHDAPIAQAGAFDGGPGIIVIAGTGTVAYGVNERGESVTVGGWGYLFGDRGGAFWLAVQALRAAARDDDEGNVSSLGSSALEFFSVPSLHALVRSFYAGDISRAHIGGFARMILQAAEREETQAASLRAEAAGELAQLAAVTSKRLRMEQPRVAFAGGMMQNTALRDLTEAELRKRNPAILIARARRDAAAGALVLARR